MLQWSCVLLVVLKVKSMRKCGNFLSDDSESSNANAAAVRQLPHAAAISLCTSLIIPLLSNASSTTSINAALRHLSATEQVPASARLTMGRPSGRRKAAPAPLYGPLR